MSRHIVISESTPAPELPGRQRVIERPDAPTLALTAAGEIPLDVWRDTLSLVREVRVLQTLYRKTLDRVILRSAEDLEALLDMRVGSLAALLAEADARRAQAAEGGGL